MICDLCGEKVLKLYRHHIVPKAKGGKNGETMDCCYTCAQQIHVYFTNAELAKMTVDELKQTPEIQKYIAWKKKHPGQYRSKMTNRMREWYTYHR